MDMSLASHIGWLIKRAFDAEDDIGDGGERNGMCMKYRLEVKWIVILTTEMSFFDSDNKFEMIRITKKAK